MYSFFFLSPSPAHLVPHRLPQQIASNADVSSLKRPFLTPYGASFYTLCDMCTVFVAQQTDLLSSPWHFLRILILVLTTLSLAICMDVGRVHLKPSLLSSEVVLTPSVTQTATWKMHVLSHFGHIPLFATP